MSLQEFPEENEFVAKLLHQCVDRTTTLFLLLIEKALPLLQRNRIGTNRLRTEDE